MNLKEMQLVGFKSFADKTTIPFQDGVTCIVGPNGCGKSNVADAVRWVLGEQSAKTLRGGSMQDVIFNGTQKRRSLSFCEVTLTFDNSSKLFDIDYGEVAMTRRLYRSGESEYLLNRQNCRLKDITALLHGVGIGKEGYSIIGQGKVAQIMNSKPEDRRAIFEEATGIMIQKKRKEEVERKLAASEDNLAVYKQRMAEAERQLAPLSRQAETAAKYNEYAGELKYHEVNAYIFRRENAETEKSKYTNEMDRLSREIERFNGEISSILSERERNRAELEAADIRLSELNTQLLKYTVGNTEKSGNAKLYKEKANAFREKLQLSQEDILSCEKRIGEIERLVVECDKRIAEKQTKLKELQAKSDALFNTVSELDKQIAVFEQDFMQDRVRELSSLENLSQLKENMGSLTARKDAVAERMDEVRAAIEKEEKRRDGLKEELALCAEKQKKLTALTASADSVLGAQSAVIRDAQEKCDRINADVYACNARIESVNNSLDLYVGLKNRFEGYKDSVRRLLYAAKTNPEVNKRIRGMIADIVSCESKYELAIETLFGGAMQNIVTATSEHAKDLIQFLKRNNIGVVTFLPVDSMRPKYNNRDIERALSEVGALGLADQIVKYDEYYAPVIRNLLGNTLVCDNNDNAVKIARKYGHSFKIVTLEGDVIATSGAMTGGSRKKDAGNLLQNERMIKQCEEEIEEKKRELSRLRSLLSQTATERTEAENKLEELRISFQSAATELATVKQQEASLQQLFGEVEGNITLYHGAVNELKQKENSLTSEAQASSESEKVLAKIRSEADEERDKKQKESDALKAERKALYEQYASLQVESVALNGAVEGERQNVTRLKSEREEMLRAIETNKRNCEQFQTEIIRWEREAELQALTKEEQETVASLRAAIAAAGEEKQKINSRQLQLETSQGGLQEKINLATTRRGKCEVEVGRIETNLENLRQRIEEAYAMSYEDCLPLRDAEYDVTVSANEISSLKRKITNLGPINANALEDYENRKVLYEEMLTQRDDLEKAIADAAQMLDEIKTSMRERFDEGFNAINENFTYIFKELFGGGKAELQLDYTNCEDPLDAGVEINACPPGKKLTKISLLSGGEQALTAIAILFAILKSNPMPFCILDEIEAALDEANVDRFARYLKKFSKETQFIVITHRKPTMNRADSLFGVTMEEKGVSKIVSVKLSEVESRLGGDTIQ
ncbi:MAG: chromosome segregation protein SMC [Clostridia bacterium]|nr:chromosome segregation protein SMC [Clostridia bacterium]